MTMEHGLVNQDFKLEHQGLVGFNAAYYNLSEPDLVAEAIKRGEGDLGIGGTLLVETGKFTGRSPKDKHVVVSETTENTVWWERNARMERAKFDVLHADMMEHIKGKDVFVADLHGGADPKERINVRVITELCWHNLFIRHLLIRPERAALPEFTSDFTIINLPSFFADPERHGCRTETVIAIDFDQRLILIGGTEYAGENKKSVFTILNYLLPAKGIMPMHCSANRAKDESGNSAIFFGLSGTGKTTLSSDPDRILVGDDEHGWSDDGIFNFEGGCYAKTISLSPESEPDIYATTSMFGTVIENMVYDPLTKELDFEDDRLTANMRAAYPIHYIANSCPQGCTEHPKNLIMLTCDAFGVMPPIAQLTPAQAMYHFLSGFTSKAAGTERGVTEPEPTFSTCFGAPFLPRRPEVYGELLREKILKHGTTCWLVNTGWTGGAYGVGTRMPIKATRALLTAAMNGDLENAQYRTDPNFGFRVPTDVAGVEPKLLDPKSTWADQAAYDQAAKKLVGLFIENFNQYLPFVDGDVKDIMLG